jgi:RNA polymerase sigma factor (sigma-70 family)
MWISAKCNQLRQRAEEGRHVRTDETALRLLMQASLDGDANAHRQLLGALVPVLRGFFGRRTGDSALAEDLVQETLIAVHMRRASYDPARPFGPWLFAVARYKLVDAWRKRRDTVALDGLEDMFGDGGFEDEVGAKLDVSVLLGTLPPKQAKAIRATKIEGLSIADVAARDGISESDVKISVHRGLKALAKRLGLSE